MSLEDKKALYSQLVSQSMTELKAHEKEIDAIYTNMGNAIYQGFNVKAENEVQ